MARTDGGEGNPGVEPRKGRRGVAWLIVIWVLVVVGLALIGEGGMLYAHSRVEGGGVSWLVGVAAIALGAALMLPALQWLCAFLQSSQTADDGLPPAQEQAIPMLGALLVFKYGAITEEQLEQALEKQRAEGEGRRLLGGILLDMGLVSMAELQTALAYQRSLKRTPQQAGGLAEAEAEPVAGAASGSTGVPA